MKKYQFTILFLIIIFSCMVKVVSQETIIFVKSFENKNERNYLYFSKEVGEDDRTGNDIVFDPFGKAFIFQWDQNLVYKLDLNYLVERTIDLPQRKTIKIQKLIKADGTILLFMNYYGLESGFDYQGIPVFDMNLWEQMQEPVVAIDYFKKVLFLVDRKNTLHSVLEPSMDQKQNMANYRDPEATKKLFAADSGVDLHGLTMDEKGMLFMNGKSFYLQNQYYGSYSYNILDQQNVYISDGKQKTRISTVTSENEIGESTAIHPSGDIYFLKYNKIKNTHILYRLKNTWDSAFRTEWYNNADTQIVK